MLFLSVCSVYKANAKWEKHHTGMLASAIAITSGFLIAGEYRNSAKWKGYHTGFLAAASAVAAGLLIAHDYKTVKKETPKDLGIFAYIKNLLWGSTKLNSDAKITNPRLFQFFLEKNGKELNKIMRSSFLSKLKPWLIRGIVIVPVFPFIIQKLQQSGLLEKSRSNKKSMADSPKTSNNQKAENILPENPCLICYEKDISIADKMSCACGKEFCLSCAKNTIESQTSRGLMPVLLCPFCRQSSSFTEQSSTSQTVFTKVHKGSLCDNFIRKNKSPTLPETELTIKEGTFKSKTDIKDLFYPTLQIPAPLLKSSENYFSTTSQPFIWRNETSNPYGMLVEECEYSISQKGCSKIVKPPRAILKEMALGGLPIKGPLTVGKTVVGYILDKHQHYEKPCNHYGLTACKGIGPTSWQPHFGTITITEDMLKRKVLEFGGSTHE